MKHTHEHIETIFIEPVRQNFNIIAWSQTYWLLSHKTELTAVAPHTEAQNLIKQRVLRVYKTH